MGLLRRGASFLAVAIVAVVLGAAATPAEAQLKRVKYTTDFGYPGRYAFLWVAIEKGYFREEGIELEIFPGKGSGDAIKQVAAGVVDIGFGDAGVVMQARGNENAPVKIVAVVYGDNPNALVVFSDSGIDGPKDLEGKTIVDTASSATRLMFPAYAQKTGIDAAKISWLLVDSTAVPSMLITGRAQAAGQFLVGLPLFAIRAAPRKVKALEYRAAGLHSYSTSIIVQEATLTRDPAMIKSFVRAVARGKAAAFADPAEAGRILNKYHREVDAAIGEGETRLVADLATQKEEARYGVGYIDPERMQATAELVNTYFRPAKPAKAEDVIAPGFVEPLQMGTK